jgi:DNA-binding NarL/FixJ family response regulator
MIHPLRPIRIMLADDHVLVRTAIKSLLLKMDGVEVIGEAQDGEELIELLRSERPDLVMIDISMPPGMDGISAIAVIHSQYPALKILVLSMHDSTEIIKKAMASGACGYLMKNAPASELEQAVRSVMDTGRYYSSAIAHRLLQPTARTPSDELTPRQFEIVKLIAQGLGSKEIGHKLGLSSKTIDGHRARIMGKLQLKDIASLTRYAVKNGMVKL